MYLAMISFQLLDVIFAGDAAERMQMLHAMPVHGPGFDGETSAFCGNRSVFPLNLLSNTIFYQIIRAYVGGVSFKKLFPISYWDILMSGWPVFSLLDILAAAVRSELILAEKQALVRGKFEAVRADVVAAAAQRNGQQQHGNNANNANQQQMEHEVSHQALAAMDNDTERRLLLSAQIPVPEGAGPTGMDLKMTPLQADVVVGVAESEVGTKSKTRNGNLASLDRSLHISFWQYVVERVLPLPAADWFAMPTENNAEQGRITERSRNGLVQTRKFPAPEHRDPWYLKNGEGRGSFLYVPGQRFAGGGSGVTAVTFDDSSKMQKMAMNQPEQSQFKSKGNKSKADSLPPLQVAERYVAVATRFLAEQEEICGGATATAYFTLALGLTWNSIFEPFVSNRTICTLKQRISFGYTGV